MDAQNNLTSEGKEPPPAQQRCRDVFYLWFDLIGGLFLLAGAFIAFRSEFGSRRVGLSLFCLGLILSGILDVLNWYFELLAWRRGGQLRMWRRWLVLFRTVGLLLILAGGSAWWLGY
jgi:hypothetical protein